MATIPRVIHQIWYQGEDQIPEHLQVYRKTWMDIHPDYTFVLWDQQVIESLMKRYPQNIQDLYNSYDIMIQRIDFARYVILYTFGGIYIDMDVKCLKSLNNIYDKHVDKNVILSYCPYDFWHSSLLRLVGLEANEKLVNNGVIACIPQHPFMLKVIQQAEKNKYTIFKHVSNMMYIFYTTGPIVVTQAYRDDKSDDVVILDNTYFEACDIDSVRKGCIPPSHAVALHVYEGSWVSPTENLLVKTYFLLQQQHVWISLFCLVLIIYIVLNKRIKQV